MQLQVAEQGGAVDVADAVFNCEFNEALVHQVVTAHMAGGRQGSKAQKTRADVSGGGKKPWRQKGTGRARSGTTRSPLWRSGGVTFAARPRDFSQKVNRKMLRKAMQAIFSELARQDRLVIVKEFGLKEAKTKALATKLKAWNIDKALIIADVEDTNLMLAARNIPNITIVDVAHIDPVNLVAHEKVILTVDTLKKIEEKLS